MSLKATVISNTVEFWQAQKNFDKTRTWQKALKRKLAMDK